MLKEAATLEALRQQIEDAEYESGSMSDYIDRGNPDAKALKNAQETILKRDEQAKEFRGRLHALIQVSPPAAVEEWIDLHISILQRIIQESVTDAHTRTRQTVAKTTLKQWQEVRAGLREYVGINWHFLKDYKAEARKINANNKRSWWEVWK